MPDDQDHVKEGGQGHPKDENRVHLKGRGDQGRRSEKDLRLGERVGARKVKVEETLSMMRDRLVEIRWRMSNGLPKI